jgi:hypothetical protein
MLTAADFMLRDGVATSIGLPITSITMTKPKPSINRLLKPLSDLGCERRLT